MTEIWFLFSTSSRTEAKTLAVLDLITSILWLSICSTLICFLYLYPDMLQEFVDEHPESLRDLGKLLKFGAIMKAVIISTLVLRPAISLILAMMLLIGAHKRCYLVVRMCLVFSVVYIIIDLILLLPRTIYLQHGSTFVLVYMVNFMYMLYQWRVVYHLVKDLSENLKGEEDNDPNTDDTVVVEAGDEDRASTPNSASPSKE